MLQAEGFATQHEEMERLHSDHAGDTETIKGMQRRLAHGPTAR